MIWLAISLLFSAAKAHAVYPSVYDLERDLHLSRGGQLGRDVQASDGTIFHTYYMSGKELGNGEYSVIVKLDR